MQMYSDATTASLLFTTIIAFIKVIFTILFIKQKKCIVIALPMIELSLKYIG